MPQSSKDARGGKTHADKKTRTAGGSGSSARKPTARQQKSPVGSQSKGHKKTTP